MIILEASCLANFLPCFKKSRAILVSEAYSFAIFLSCFKQKIISLSCQIKATFNDIFKYWRANTPPHPSQFWSLSQFDSQWQPSAQSLSFYHWACQISSHRPKTWPCAQWQVDSNFSLRQSTCKCLDVLDSTTYRSTEGFCEFAW